MRETQGKLTSNLGRKKRRRRFIWRGIKVGCAPKYTTRALLYSKRSMCMYNITFVWLHSHHYMLLPNLHRCYGNYKRSNVIFELTHMEQQTFRHVILLCCVNDYKCGLIRYLICIFLLLRCSDLSTSQHPSMSQHNVVLHWSCATLFPLALSK